MLLKLSEIDIQTTQDVGGKALGLSRLVRAGLPVPNALVIPASDWIHAARSAGLDLNAAPELLVGQIRQMILPDGWASAWQRAASRLGERVAVRSSAMGEDGDKRSFAGQYRTELSVDPAVVADAVRRVWASLYEAPAVAYLGRAGGRMAVVIQRQVNPRCSGVMFTVNPLNGSWREMVVEAVWGLGETLVSGQVAPHWYLVRRPHRLRGSAQRLWSRIRLEPMQAELPELTERCQVSVDGQLEHVPVRSHEIGRRTLSEAQLLKLCRLGLRAERHLGGPMDVEWCIDERGVMMLLQARPITTTESAPVRTDVVWTRRFIGERFPDPVTPLGWSIMGATLNRFIAYPGVQERYLGGGPSLKLVSGRPYINATVFRHLSFKLPGAPMVRFISELVQPEEEAGWRRRHTIFPDVTVYLAILQATIQERRWKQFRWNPLTNPEAWRQWKDRLTISLPIWHEPASSELSAVSRSVEHQRWIQTYVGIHVCSLLFANICYQLLDSALASWIPERRSHLMDVLATCPLGNRTLEVNAALWKLGQQATQADLTRLEQGRAPRKGFAPALQAFLETYGHRADASWEMCAPRWAEDPGQLVPLLRAQLGEGVSDPSLRGDAVERRFEQAMDEVRATLSPGRRLLFEMLVRYTRTYLLLRENQRFWFDQLLWSAKQNLWDIGGHFVERGWLSSADDIQWLRWPEIQALSREELSAEAVSDWVRRRRAEHKDSLSTEVPPVFLSGSRPVAVGRNDGKLRGQGISAGRVRGRVRVVRRLSEGSQLKPGEVLVARAVDPGWTPLFHMASAVVLELGSALSHGAVVAREYEIPGVVNIDGATHVLENGQEVTVDGTLGVVWLH
ncbi:MAG: hypothetical protein GWP91_03100 [Rhodobacterales bacterium]|nr:hypothetical protein [Rhodobacterales bacterium]